MKHFKKLFSVVITAVIAITAALTTKTGVIPVYAATSDSKETLEFSVICDNNLLTEDNGASYFYEELDYLINCDITWIRPSHSTYYDYVNNAFLNKDIPDVVLLSTEYMGIYAANGYLWDMSDAWANSKTKKSDRLKDGAIKRIESNKVLKDDGTYGMYGFSPQTANGCATYIKSSDLKLAGYDPETVKNATLTFDEYYKMLKDIKSATGREYIIYAPGFYSSEAPYTNYLPEFYQDAHFSFYMNDKGYYEDGFSETAMKNALSRLATAVSDGIISKSSLGAKTSEARSIFYQTDGSAVLTYWNGVWGRTLRDNYLSKGGDGELIMIKPIKELGSYIERNSTSVWAITQKAADEGKAQKIFDRFIDTMLDGSDIQMLWTYGVKGVHWDDKAETVTWGSNSATYKEGEFHMLPQLSYSSSLFSKAYIDPMLSFAEFASDTDGEKADKVKGVESLSEEVRSEIQIFKDNSHIEKIVPITTEYADYYSDIFYVREEVVIKVVLGEWTVEEGMAYYSQTVGSYVAVVLDSLNEKNSTILYGFVTDEDGNTYYYKNNEKMTGWIQVNNKWYFMNSKGIMQKGWLCNGGKWYYLNSNGQMQKGWVYSDGKYYHMDRKGAMQTGWIYILGEWYYLNSKGVMVTGWQQIDGKWYYMDSEGAMTTGWLASGGKWYYMNSKGIMTTGWQQISGKWYYMNSKGQMQTGWVSDGGKWYYMNKSGVMQTGWQLIGGKYYYFYTSGVMASDTKIDGYYVNKDGVWVK